MVVMKVSGLSRGRVSLLHRVSAVAAKTEKPEYRLYSDLTWPSVVSCSANRYHLVDRKPAIEMDENRSSR